MQSDLRAQAMEVCKSSTSDLCLINFLIALASSLSVFINVVCASILMKTTPLCAIK